MTKKHTILGEQKRNNAWLLTPKRAAFNITMLTQLVLKFKLKISRISNLMMNK